MLKGLLCESAGMPGKAGAVFSEALVIVEEGVVGVVGVVVAGVAKMR